MKKILVAYMLMLGLTFIYNPANGVGFVYLNQDIDNWIIIVDANMNVLRYYRAEFETEKKLDSSIDQWLRDKVEKGMPFKSQIIPYRSQQQQMQERKRTY